MIPITRHCVLPSTYSAMKWQPVEPDASAAQAGQQKCVAILPGNQESRLSSSSC